MKKALILTTMVSALLLVGCAISPLPNEQSAKASVNAAIEPEIITLIGELGYKTDDIRISGDNYIVEGDVEIPKNYLEELKTESLTRGDPKHYYYEGGTLTGPALEAGDVLYTNKSYTFHYKPYYYTGGVNALAQMVDIAVNGSRHKETKLSNVSVQHTFTKPGSYEAKGSITYYVDLTNAGALIPNRKAEYVTYSQSKIYRVIDPLAIVGPNSVELNVNATYGVTILMDDATFNGWTVTGGTYTTTSGLSSRNLTIKFTEYEDYTLTANFTLPGNVPYSVTQTVDLRLIISGSVQAWQGRTATFNVSNDLSGASYQWEVVENCTAIGSSTSTTFQVMPAYAGSQQGGSGTKGYPPDPNYPPIPDDEPVYLTLRCRVTSNGLTSEWVYHSVLLRG